MKLQQHPVFQPITITLETSEEAVAFWEILGSVKSDHGAADDLACRISNWLSEHAQLGKQPTKGE